MIQNAALLFDTKLKERSGDQVIEIGNAHNLGS